MIAARREVETPAEPEDERARARDARGDGDCCMNRLPGQSSCVSERHRESTRRVSKRLSDKQQTQQNFLLRGREGRVVEPWAKFLKATAQLSTAQYNVLRILRGSHPTRLACGDISQRMIDRDPDVTRLVDRLAKRGLVTRTRNRKDRRVVEVGITEQGLALVRELDPDVARLPKALLGHLGPERGRQLAELLGAVISGLGTYP